MQLLDLLCLARYDAAKQVGCGLFFATCKITNDVLSLFSGIAGPNQAD